MTARVLTCLYTTDSGSLTAAELVAWLKISPASVSTAVGFLEGQGLLRRERADGRRERYVVDDDVWLRALVETARVNRILADAAIDGAGAFGQATPTGARLERFGRFLGKVSEEMMASIERSLVEAGEWQGEWPEGLSGERREGEVDGAGAGG
nr:MarR family transcriptional regulator [Actinorhabdospora filicis]